MNFDKHIVRWGLVPDGDPISTHSSDLLPALKDGVPVMLKIARPEEEQSGALLMKWWGGQGAARVLELEGDALLMERAIGPRSLNGMVREGTTTRRLEFSVPLRRNCMRRVGNRPNP